MPGQLYETMVACDRNSLSPECEKSPQWREVARSALSVLNQIYPKCPLRVTRLEDPVTVAVRAVEAAEDAAAEQRIDASDPSIVQIPTDVGRFTAERYGAVKHASEHGCPPKSASADAAPLPSALNGKRTSRDMFVALAFAAAALLFISQIKGSPP